MRYTTLGDSGLAVSALGIGCNAFGARTDADEVVRIVDVALERGVTFFDTADKYSLGESETLLGRALQGRRDEVVVATKFGLDMEGVNGPDWGRRGSRRYVRMAVEASLRRLGTEWIDLYQLHTPDRVTPLEETLTTLDDLVREGKVRYVGCSNFEAWELADAHWRAKNLGVEAFVSAQNEYSLYNRSAERDLAPACEHLGVGLIPYFPLAYGLLTGKYRQGESAPQGSRLAQQTARLEGADWQVVDALTAFADSRGVPLLHVALGGLAAQSAVSTVIAGVSRAGQVAANADAIEWEPSETDLADLDAAVPRATGYGHASFATARA